MTELKAPIRDDSVDWQPLTAHEIAGKTNSFCRREVPPEATCLTAFVDIHRHILYWTVMAWESDFTGYVLDYEVWPVLNLQTGAEGEAEEPVCGALRRLVGNLLGSTWNRGDGEAMAIDRMLIDAGYDTGTVRGFCRDHGSDAILPSFGRMCGPNEVPISQYRQGPGEEIGQEWILGRPDVEGVRRVMFDAMYWKTFFLRRLATPAGAPGSVTLFGYESEERPAKHYQFAPHLDSERRQRIVGVRAVDVWTPKPGTIRNHWLDCVVGCSVAASLCGCRLVGPSAVT